MNAMKYVAITLNFDFFRGRGVNQDKRERMVVLVPKFLSLNYSVKLGLEKKEPLIEPGRDWSLFGEGGGARRTASF